MGNRNAVANNGQITDGIARAVGPAVYNAVTKAMSSKEGKGGDLYLTIELGGSQYIQRIVRDYNKLKKHDPQFGFIN